MQRQARHRASLHNAAAVRLSLAHTAAQLCEGLLKLDNAPGLTRDNLTGNIRVMRSFIVLLGRRSGAIVFIRRCRVSGLFHPECVSKLAEITVKPLPDDQRALVPFDKAGDDITVAHTFARLRRFHSVRFPSGNATLVAWGV